MKKYILFILASLSLVSCVDTLILPDDKTVDEDFWQKKNDVKLMVNQAYASLASNDVVQRFIVWGDLRSDEFNVVSTLNSAAAQDLKEINSANIQTDNIYANWGSLYATINYCNIVIARAPEVLDLDPNYLEGDYNADVAEMKALRALCYFYLVRSFRDVPLSTTAFMQSSQELNLVQSNPKVVMDQVIKDLEEAWPNALKSEGTFDATWMPYGYMTKNAIWAVLADAYLWRASVLGQTSDYEKCIEYCDKIKEARKIAYQQHGGGFGHFGGGGGNTVNEDEYYLNSVANYYDIFSDGAVGRTSEAVSVLKQPNNTALCQMYFKVSSNSSQNGFLTASNTYGTLGSNPNDFTFANANDVRGYESVYGFNTGADEFHVRKMIAVQGRNGKVEAESRQGSRGYENFNQDWMLYRITDVMLMKAEACVQLDRNEEAVYLVSQVNKRALIETAKADSITWATYQNATKDDLELLVMQERARELCFEGKRWFDLLRYNYRHSTGVRYDLTLSEQKKQGIPFVANYTPMLSLIARKYNSGGTGVTSKMLTEPYLYMPILQSEMDVNPNLVQNPVYSENNQWKKDL